MRPHNGTFPFLGCKHFGVTAPVACQAATFTSGPLLWAQSSRSTAAANRTLKVHDMFPSQEGRGLTGLGLRTRQHAQTPGGGPDSALSKQAGMRLCTQTGGSGRGFALRLQPGVGALLSGGANGALRSGPGRGAGRLCAQTKGWDGTLLSDTRQGWGSGLRQQVRGGTLCRGSSAHLANARPGLNPALHLVVSAQHLVSTWQQCAALA